MSEAASETTWQLARRGAVPRQPEETPGELAYEVQVLARKAHSEARMASAKREI